MNSFTLKIDPFCLISQTKRIKVINILPNKKAYGVESLLH